MSTGNLDHTNAPPAPTAPPIDHNYSNMVPMHKRIRQFKINGQSNISKLPTAIHDRWTIHKRIMGHLAHAYCVCFDQTGEFVFSGADDHLIKIWCSRTGRLIKSLRGHERQVSDMSVDYDNRLLASVGQDRILRIWDLRTSKLIQCIPIRSTITSVKFSPYNRHDDHRYLVTTSNDGVVRIFSYHKDKLDKFEAVIAYKERNRPGGQLTCSSFSTGGSFLALGASDNAIHVYGFHPCFGPYSLTHSTGGLLGHEDKVDSIQFCNRGYRFVSGSKDGTARVWNYRQQIWKSIVLDMDTQLDQSVVRRGQQKPPQVLIVQWSRDDRYVMTSLVDHSIKVWESKTGRLVHILREHKHDIYVLESHPTDPRIFVSAGHDGYLCIWDLETGKCIKKIIYSIPGPDGPIQIYDMKFSPQGDLIATTDNHGYITFVSTGSPARYAQVPDQMFFNTDYHMLIRDANHFVLDDLTHLVPHLMPRPRLVDMNGDPYPNSFQGLVPDHKCGEKYVIPPMNPHQQAALQWVLESHSMNEDEEYTYQKQDHLIDSDNTEIYDTDTTETYSDYEYPVRKHLTKRRYQTRSSGSRNLSVRSNAKRSGGRTLRPRAKRLCRFTT